MDRGQLAGRMSTGMRPNHPAGGPPPIAALSPLSARCGLWLEGQGAPEQTRQSVINLARITGGERREITPSLAGEANSGARRPLPPLPPSTAAWGAAMSYLGASRGARLPSLTHDHSPGPLQPRVPRQSVLYPPPRLPAACALPPPRTPTVEDPQCRCKHATWGGSSLRDAHLWPK